VSSPSTDAAFDGSAPIVAVIVTYARTQRRRYRPIVGACSTGGHPTPVQSSSRWSGHL